MTLPQNIKRYYPSMPGEHHYNCAESMLMAIEDTYNLTISEDAKIQMLAFGGGLNVGETCGLLIGSYAGLSLMYHRGLITHDYSLKEILQEWFKLFNSGLNGFRCLNLKNEEDLCNDNAQRAAALLEDYILKLLTCETSN